MTEFKKTFQRFNQFEKKNLITFVNYTTIHLLKDIIRKTFKTVKNKLNYGIGNQKIWLGLLQQVCIK